MAEEFTAGILCAMVSTAAILFVLVFDPSPASVLGIKSGAIVTGSIGLALGFTLMLSGILAYL